MEKIFRKGHAFVKGLIFCTIISYQALKKITDDNDIAGLGNQQYTTIFFNKFRRSQICEPACVNIINKGITAGSV